MNRFLDTLNNLYTLLSFESSEQKRTIAFSRLESLVNQIKRVLSAVDIQFKDELELLSILHRFFDEKLLQAYDRREAITAYDYAYCKMVVNDLDEIVFKKHGHTFPLNLIELMIYWNLNTWQVISFLHQSEKESLMAISGSPQTVSWYRLWLHDLKRIPRQNVYRFQPLLPDLHTYLEDQITAHIRQLERPGEITPTAVPIKAPAAGNHATQGKHPLHVNLSSDQIGILLRVLFDKGIFITKSVRLLFRLIVPFIATGTKELLSWDSVRKRVYPPERSDILAVKKLLHDMAEYLDSY